MATINFGKLSDEERKKLLEELSNSILNQMNSYSTYADPSLRPNATPSIPYPTRYSGISPTNVDARGMYVYQEPERDEQGTYYGYKILLRANNNCECIECSTLRSPRYPVLWGNGCLAADNEPSENTMFGIHFAKSADHPELMKWVHHSKPDERSVLVKCTLSGTVVETEQGFRAQYAQIIGVYENGNWQSYQDYQECSRPLHSKWKDDAEREWKSEQWRAYIDWDKSNPNITSYP